jgi:hypothetical protein
LGQESKKVWGKMLRHAAGLAPLWALLLAEIWRKTVIEFY